MPVTTGLAHARDGRAENVQIVAKATVERVASADTGKRVVSGPAGEDVHQRVARATEGCSACVAEVFDIRPQSVGREIGQDQIGSGHKAFDHHIRYMVHDIGVILAAAFHAVACSTTVESVVSGTADERVASSEAADQVAGHAAGQAVCAFASVEDGCQVARREGRAIVTEGGDGIACPVGDCSGLDLDAVGGARKEEGDGVDPQSLAGHGDTGRGDVDPFDKGTVAADDEDMAAARGDEFVEPQDDVIRVADAVETACAVDGHEFRGGEVGVQGEKIEETVIEARPFHADEHVDAITAADGGDGDETRARQHEIAGDRADEPCCVLPCTAVKTVVTAHPVKDVVRRVARDGIVPVATDRVLDHRIGGDLEEGRAAECAGRAGVQVE